MAAKLLRPVGLQAFTVRGGGSAGQGDRSGSDLETTGMGHAAVGRRQWGVGLPRCHVRLSSRCFAELLYFCVSENLQATAPPGTQIPIREGHSGMRPRPPLLFPSETSLRVTSPSTAVILKSCLGSAPRISLDPWEKVGWPCSLRSVVFKLL